jgi:hypothetical protein
MQQPHPHMDIGRGVHAQLYEVLQLHHCSGEAVVFMHSCTMWHTPSNVYREAPLTSSSQDAINAVRALQVWFIAPIANLFKTVQPISTAVHRYHADNASGTLKVLVFPAEALLVSLSLFQCQREDGSSCITSARTNQNISFKQ